MKHKQTSGILAQRIHLKIICHLWRLCHVFLDSNVFFMHMFPQNCSPSCHNMEDLLEESWFFRVIFIFNYFCLWKWFVLDWRSHPHGIMSLGAFTTFCTDGTGFWEAYSGLKPYLAALNGQFWFPFRREFILLSGMSLMLN